MAFAIAPGARAQTDSFWTAAVSGDWTDASRWSTNPQFPANGATTYRAIIDAAGGPYTVTLNRDVALDEVLVVSAGATLDHVGGTLEVIDAIRLAAGALRLAGGRIQNGTIRSNGGGKLVTLGDESELHDMTLDIETEIAAESELNVTGGLTLREGRSIRLFGTSVPNQSTGLRFIDDQTLGGEGEVIFDGQGKPSFVFADASSGSRGTLTVGAGVTVRTGGGDGWLGRTRQDLVIEGLVAVDTDNVLRVAGNWTNRGTFRVANGVLELRDEFVGQDIGRLERTGGTIRITGHFLNSGDFLRLDASTGSFELGEGGRVTGGAIVTQDGTELIASAGESTLEDVVIDADVRVVGDAVLTIHGGDPLARGRRITFEPRGGHARLVLPDGVDMMGAGQILFTGSPGDGSTIRKTGDLTIGPDVVLSAQSGNARVGDSDFGLVLRGTVISALPSGSESEFWPWIGLSGATVRNEGTIIAENRGAVSLNSLVGPIGDLQIRSGGSVRIHGNYTNTRDRLISGGGSLTLGDTWENLATIRVDQGTLGLEGATLGLGTIIMSDAELLIGNTYPSALIEQIDYASTVVTLGFNGNVDNVGDELVLDATTGSWMLAKGGITGGSIVGRDGAKLIVVDGNRGQQSSFVSNALIDIDIEILNNSYFWMFTPTNRYDDVVRLAPGNLRLFGQSATLAEAGRIEGVGSVDVLFVSDLVNEGTIRPGDPVGSLLVDGNLVMRPTGVIDMQIMGPAAGTGHDVLEISGDLSLDGVLDVHFIGGYAPLAGDVFDLLTLTGDGEIIGSFAEVSVFGLEPGFQFAVGRTLSTVFLEALNDGVHAPEPASVAVMVVALTVLGRGARRRTA
ncbi:MAG: hypothetical protein CMJ18_17050 [Phycisphaeraceae bacterium]|nr:hypothetical protein [Phycisphaeraceae bacterium]